MTDICDQVNREILQEIIRLASIKIQSTKHINQKQFTTDFSSLWGAVIYLDYDQYNYIVVEICEDKILIYANDNSDHSGGISFTTYHFDLARPNSLDLAAERIKILDGMMRDLYEEVVDS